ncbi:hypothetical protein BLNAU_45 [Blattamonas nauphoetae]|uniref:SAM domain-containing protein n=1 Tax=Blattamonas nauphoetae TaxID=2049346 RepID=A0ABQ9YM77_9EUKA|nr:hypothetical protein BLNAU_45 [Blattamonas nauphoetae]
MTRNRVFASLSKTRGNSGLIETLLDETPRKKSKYPEILEHLISRYPPEVLSEMKLLDLSHRQLVKIPKLDKFGSIVELDLSHNCIRRLKVKSLVRDVPNLTKLDLSFNELSIFTDITQLGVLRHLTSLSIQGNPLPISENRIVLIASLLLDKTTVSLFERRAKQRDIDLVNYLATDITLNGPHGTSIKKRARPKSASVMGSRHSTLKDQSRTPTKQSSKHTTSSNEQTSTQPRVQFLPEATVHNMFERVTKKENEEVAEYVTETLLGHRWTPAESEGRLMGSAPHSKKNIVENSTDVDRRRQARYDNDPSTMPVSMFVRSMKESLPEVSPFMNDPSLIASPRTPTRSKSAAHKTDFVDALTTPIRDMPYTEALSPYAASGRVSKTQSRPISPTQPKERRSSLPVRSHLDEQTSQALTPHHSSIPTSPSGRAQTGIPVEAEERSDFRHFDPPKDDPYDEQLLLKKGYKMIPARLRETEAFLSMSKETAEYIVKNPPPQEYMDQVDEKKQREASKQALAKRKALFRTFKTCDSSSQSGFRTNSKFLRGNDSDDTNGHIRKTQTPTQRRMATMTPPRDRRSEIGGEEFVKEVPVYIKHLSDNLDAQRQLDSAKQKVFSTPTKPLRTPIKTPLMSKQTPLTPKRNRPSTTGASTPQQQPPSSPGRSTSTPPRINPQNTPNKDPYIYSSQPQGRIKFFGFKPGQDSPSRIISSIQQHTGQPLFYFDLNTIPTPRKGPFPLLVSLNGKNITVDELDAARNQHQQHAQLKAELSAPVVFGGLEKIDPPTVTFTGAATGGMKASEVIGRQQLYKKYVINQYEEEKRMRESVAGFLATGEWQDDGIETVEEKRKRREEDLMQVEIDRRRQKAADRKKQEEDNRRRQREEEEERRRNQPFLKTSGLTSDKDGERERKRKEEQKRREEEERLREEKLKAEEEERRKEKEKEKAKLTVQVSTPTASERIRTPRLSPQGDNQTFEVGDRSQDERVRKEMAEIMRYSEENTGRSLLLGGNYSASPVTASPVHSAQQEDKEQQATVEKVVKEEKKETRQEKITRMKQMNHRNSRSALNPVGKEEGKRGLTRKRNSAFDSAVFDDEKEDDNKRRRKKGDDDGSRGREGRTLTPKNSLHVRNQSKDATISTFISMDEDTMGSLSDSDSSRLDDSSSSARSGLKGKGEKKTSGLPSTLVKLYKQTFEESTIVPYSQLPDRRDAMGYGRKGRSKVDQELEEEAEAALSEREIIKRRINTEREKEGRAQAYKKEIGKELLKIQVEMDQTENLIEMAEEHRASFNLSTLNLPPNSHTLKHLQAKADEPEDMPLPRLPYSVVKNAPSLNSSTLLVPPPVQWKTYDVELWLHRIGMSHYAHLDEWKAMTGYYLVTMKDQEDLRTELKIESVEDRKTMWDEIEKLKKQRNKSTIIKRTDVPAHNVKIHLGQELWRDFRRTCQRHREEDEEVEERRKLQEKRHTIRSSPHVSSSSSHHSQLEQRILERSSFTPTLARSLEASRDIHSSIFPESAKIIRKKREEELLAKAKAEIAAQTAIRRGETVPLSLESVGTMMKEKGEIPKDRVVVGMLKTRTMNTFAKPKKAKGSDGFWTTDFESVPIEELDTAEEHFLIQNDIDFMGGGPSGFNEAVMNHMLLIDKQNKESIAHQKQLVIHKMRLKQIREDGVVDERTQAVAKAQHKPVSFIAARAEERLAKQNQTVDELSHILDSVQKEQIANKAKSQTGERAGGAQTSLDSHFLEAQRAMQEIDEDALNLAHNIDDPLFHLNHSTKQAQESVTMTNTLVSLGSSFISYSSTFKDAQEKPVKLKQPDSLRLVPKQWVKKVEGQRKDVDGRKNLRKSADFGNTRMKGTLYRDLVRKAGGDVD